ncbi:MAG: CGNR zinc finger domain-containing protein [Solirubrobacteraceae bacterium]
MTKNQAAPGTLELVRQFVNTVDLEQSEERLPTPEALSTWLADQHLISAPTPADATDLQHAIGLREALRAILLAHNGGPAVPAAAEETFDDAACRARLQLRFRGGDMALEPEADGVDAGLGRLLAIMHAAIAQHTWERLKACREHTCEWAFYDHTKNRSGAWCNMRVCGNRAKARAYRERQVQTDS